MFNNGLEKRPESSTVRRMSGKGRVFVTQSISFPPRLLASVKERAANLGLPLSSYVQKCLERDLETRSAIVFEEKKGGYGSDAPEKALRRKRRVAESEKVGGGEAAQ